MERVELKERFAPKVVACFEDEQSFENAAMTYSSIDSLAKNKEKTGFSRNAEILITILRQVFLFFPGAFALYFVTVSLTGFFYFKPYVIGGSQVPLSLIIGFISSILTFLGLGNIKNPKHLIIPLSIIVFSIAIGLLGCYRYDSGTFLYFLGRYVPLFFPLALIIPFFAKFWIDNLGKKE